MKTKDAISAFGSAKALAEALKITQSAISQWGDDVPLLRAFQIKERCEYLPTIAATACAAQATESKEGRA